MAKEEGKGEQERTTDGQRWRSEHRKGASQETVSELAQADTARSQEKKKRRSKCRQKTGKIPLVRPLGGIALPHHTYRTYASSNSETVAPV